MKRREFFAVMGGAVSWPLPVRAQQSGRVPRIAMISNLNADDPEFQARHAAFLRGLQEFGWIVGRNVQIDIWSTLGDADRTRRVVGEIVAAAPTVIFTVGSATVAPLLQMTRAIPIVFVIVPDPVAAGFVDSMARPGGNATGFSEIEYSQSAKWLEFLKQIAPAVKRVAIIRDPAITAGIGQFAAIQTVAQSFAVELVPVNVRNASEIERAVTGFARTPDDGLIVTGSALSFVHRKLIVELAAQHKLPAVYWNRAPVIGGGLLAYGPDFYDMFWRAAGYVDRILKGEKPADLPVQAPTKYQLTINLKTAKVLGLAVPATLLARADEVIE